MTPRHFVTVTQWNWWNCYFPAECAKTPAGYDHDMTWPNPNPKRWKSLWNINLCRPARLSPAHISCFAHHAFCSSPQGCMERNLCTSFVKTLARLSAACVSMGMRVSLRVLRFWKKSCKLLLNSLLYVTFPWSLSSESLAICIIPALFHSTSYIHRKSIFFVSLCYPFCCIPSVWCLHVCVRSVYLTLTAQTPHCVCSLYLSHKPGKKTPVICVFFGLTPPLSGWEATRVFIL